MIYRRKDQSCYLLDSGNNSDLFNRLKIISKVLRQDPASFKVRKKAQKEDWKINKQILTHLNKKTQKREREHR